MDISNILIPKQKWLIGYPQVYLHWKEKEVLVHDAIVCTQNITPNNIFPPDFLLSVILYAEGRASGYAEQREILDSKSASEIGDQANSNRKDWMKERGSKREESVSLIKIER